MFSDYLTLPLVLECEKDLRNSHGCFGSFLSCLVLGKICVFVVVVVFDIRAVGAGWLVVC